MDPESPQYILINARLDSSIPFELPPNVEEEGIISEIQGYKHPKIKLFLYVFGSILSMGLLPLVCFWSLGARVFFRLRKTGIGEADTLLIRCPDQQEVLVPLQEVRLKQESDPENEGNEQKNNCFKCFEFRLFRYFYHEEKGRFVPQTFNLEEHSCTQIHQLYGQGANTSLICENRLIFYGLNSTEIPDKSIFSLLVEEIFSSFFVFQVFSCLVWMLEEYEVFSGIILATSIVSSGITLYETKKNLQNLREMSSFECPIAVYRGMPENLYQSQAKASLSAHRQVISSLELIPGDIIEITNNQKLPCDAILLNGSCITDESMLTGESVPIVKQALPYNTLRFSPFEDGKASMLYAGTMVLEARFYMKERLPVLGLVYRTGFATMKGQLIRSILYPRQNVFNFFHESLKFLLAVSLISIIGLIYTLLSYISLEDDVYDIVLTCVDLITITIPPALPTCMSIGAGFSLIRLKRRLVFCIAPGRINLAGKVNIMCFDKTGTLTEDGLELLGIRIASKYEVRNQIKLTGLLTVCPIYETDVYYTPGDTSPSVLQEAKLDRSQLMVEILASCHSLTLINGSLTGDSLDRRMFAWTGWVLSDNSESTFDQLVLAVVKPKSAQETNDFDRVREIVQNDDFPNEIGIIRRFEFSSKLQRMSVVVRNLNENKFRLHVKGSPEVIRELCKSCSIPDNFHAVLNDYAKSGYRVIACASRRLKVSFRSLLKLDRKVVEKELTFFGFIILENKLKEPTTAVISELQAANIRCIMVTGDNILTSISVARQCGIVKQDLPVYYGDIGEKQVNGKAALVWRDFELNEQVLNPNTLQPDEAKEEEKQPVSKEFEPKKDGIGLKRLEISGFGRKNKVFFNSFSEKQMTLGGNTYKAVMPKNPNPSNFRTMSQFKEKYVLSEIIPKIEIEDSIQSSLLEYIDDNPPIWQNIEGEHFYLAISGRAFNLLHQEKMKGNPTLFKKMLEKTQIFARMKPADKTLLIQSLQGLRKSGTFVGMCGDGANDCGALKQADAGVSLSEAEASIAAPFTSKIQDISCIVDILKEGRCSLTTSFQCFKNMALYSAIQFAGCTILNGMMLYFTNFEYLWVDLFLIFPLAVFMSYTQPYELLTKFLPSSSLLSFSVLASVIGQVMIQILFQVAVFLFVKGNYTSCDVMMEEMDDEDPICYENNVVLTKALFLFANFQYLSTVIVFSIGPPFRQPFYTNVLFTLTFLVLFACCCVLLVYPSHFLLELFSLLDFPWDLKCYLAVVTLLNFLLTFLYEKYCVNKFTFYWKALKRRIKNKTR